ncbi:MAG: ATP synthase F1 subunit gamma [Clostridia bacterium]|nr:ATP synthase F1 subunit gamma [Clostridia bacterium]
MAGASMNDIKARMKSVESTMQITKAMELVATSKLRRAKEKAENTRPFLSAVGNLINQVRSSAELSGSVFAAAKEGAKHLFVVIAGDRGLAGGYNAGVFRLSEQLSKDEDAIFLPIGKKAHEYFTHRSRELYVSEPITVAEAGVGRCLSLGKAISDGFIEGRIGRVTLIYTEFTSMMTQTPRTRELLPLTPVEKSDADFLVCGEPEELLLKAVPTLVGGMLSSAVFESSASESGARRTAMNAANKNASEMIDSLQLTFNRARQAVITQEITEIVSGAEAL